MDDVVWSRSIPSYRFGHEAVGEVLEVGDEVKDCQLRQGDHFVDEGKRRRHEPPKFTEESGADVNFGQCCTFVTRGVFPKIEFLK